MLQNVSSRVTLNYTTRPAATAASGVTATLADLLSASLLLLVLVLLGSLLSSGFLLCSLSSGFVL